jgi:hypothetical protein
MAVRTLTSALSAIGRTASLPAVSPLTSMASFYVEAVAAGGYRNLLSINKSAGALDFTDPYVWVGLDTADGETLMLEVWDGASSFVSTGPAVQAGSSIHVALRVNGNLHEVLYSTTGLSSDAAVVCSVNQPNNIGTLGIMYFFQEYVGGKIRCTNAKVFSTNQTAAAIRLERDSYKITDTANDYSAPRLRWRADITDSSGNARHWTQIVGTLQDIDGFPLLAPSNISAPMATSLGTSLPVSGSQNARVGGLTHDLWFKRTAQVGDKVLGWFPFGDLIAYDPATFLKWGADPYTPDGSRSGGTNKPIQFAVEVGQTYYFQASALNASTANPATLTYDLRRHQELPVPDGAIFVNDDTDGLPAAILDPTDGSVLRFVQDIPAGESGFVLADGTMLLEDHDAQNLKLFDADFNLLETIDFDLESTDHLGAGGISGNKVDRFYVARAHSVAATNAPAYSVRTIDRTGAFGPTTWIVGSNDNTRPWAIAPSPDESILYIANHSIDNLPIRRWDLVNDVALSDLTAAPGAGWRPRRQILVLKDGSVLVGWSNGASSYVVYRYSPEGTVLNTYDYSADVLTPQNSQLAHAVNDPLSFWLWLKTSYTSPFASISRFINIRASTGDELASFDAVQYENGVYNGDATEDPLARFGHSESCPFLILGAGDDPDGIGDGGVIGPLVWVHWPRVIPDLLPEGGS